jgi:hypothetical protein
MYSCDLSRRAAEPSRASALFARGSMHRSRSTRRRRETPCRRCDRAATPRRRTPPRRARRRPSRTGRRCRPCPQSASRCARRGRPLQPTCSAPTRRESNRAAPGAIAASRRATTRTRYRSWASRTQGTMTARRRTCTRSEVGATQTDKDRAKTGPSQSVGTRHSRTTGQEGQR